MDLSKLSGSAFDLEMPTARKTKPAPAPKAPDMEISTSKLAERALSGKGSSQTMRQKIAGGSPAAATPRIEAPSLRNAPRRLYRLSGDDVSGLKAQAVAAHQSLAAHLVPLVVNAQARHLSRDGHQFLANAILSLGAVGRVVAWLEGGKVEIGDGDLDVVMSAEKLAMRAKEQK